MYLGREKGILGKFVAVLGIIQSLGYLAICITCIVFYHHPPNVPSSSLNATTYTQYLSTVITQYYIHNDTDSSGGTRIIRPNDFHALMWIYLIVSAIWIAASIDEYKAIKDNKARQGHITLLLGILLLLISIVDLIFFSLLARDLNQCSFATLEEGIVTNQDHDCHVGTGIVMTLAARGYVLWVINLILGIVMIISAAEVFKSRTPKILSYDNNTIPRVQIGKSNPPVALSPIEKDNPFFRGGMNPALNPATRPVTPNRNSTPVALTGRNNTNMYF